MRRYIAEIWPEPNRYLFKLLPWDYDTWLCLKTWLDFLCSRSQEAYNGAAQVSWVLIPQPSAAVTPACWEHANVSTTSSHSQYSTSDQVWSQCHHKDRCSLFLSSCNARSLPFWCLPEPACTPRAVVEAQTGRYLLPVRMAHDPRPCEKLFALQIESVMFICFLE